MTGRQLNAWNWSATTVVYCGGFKDLLTSFETQQYWDGSKAGHERLMKALVERLEGMSDRLGLQYELYQPPEVADKKWAATLPPVVRIDRFPF